MRNGGSELAAAEPTRVLVVEDDEASRRAVVQCLREDGCIVFEAPDGLAGLDLAGRERIDLIVLDLMLPKLDGEHVLERLRRTSAVAVIVVSAKREEDDRVTALELGADDYLTKPFTVRELRARMRAVLRRVEGEVTSAILVGDVMIDLDAKTASRGGTRIALTPMEFDLLVLLARHRGKLVSREQIELAIHAGAEPQVSNVVDVLVLRLRKKLGQELITTRRGHGFIIDA
jgi:two-component system OmpR family response regulator